MAPNSSSQWLLSTDALRWHINPSELGIKKVTDLEPCDEIIGQERAVRAIQTGLEIQSHGYNIYVSGLTGTGKTTTIHKLLMQMNGHTESPEDICFVYNFTQPDMPRCLTFPAGRGKVFAKSMDQTIRSLLKHIPELYERDQYKRQHDAIVEELTASVKQEIEAFEKEIASRGLALVQVQSEQGTRPEIFPVINEAVTPWNKMPELLKSGTVTAEALAALQADHDRYMESLQEIASHHQELEKEAQERVDGLDRQTAAPTVKAQIKRLKDRFDLPKVALYLDDVAQDILDNLYRFQPQDDAGPAALLPQSEAAPGDELLNYEVNVVVDNTRTKGKPIVVEKAPTYANLFGSIEKIWDPTGVWRTDFTKIKAGSLLRANGGYLVFNLLDAAHEPAVWSTIKRTLKNQQLIIQNTEAMGGFSTNVLKPEPVDINLKVVIIGDEMTYRELYDLDDEFKKIFKIRADFDTVMPNTESTRKLCIQFASKITKDESLLPMTRDGMAALLEHSVWLAGKRSKLSTRFSDVADIMREAHYWALQNKDKHITDAHIDKAVEERHYRTGLIKDKIHEMITEGSVLIDVDGYKVGQVNGLSVLSLGDLSFGQPSRITAEVSVGRAGIINIEREAGLSGPTHNKGVLILSGYLRRLYAQDKPLTLSGSLCFEQNYGGVDGDSASSTEIYALLSALSELPIRQDVAVTGSVNQKGEIQPIGGVNEKIEGFFDVCSVKGFTGSQGVMIPRTNIDDLMLRKDVLQAVEQGRFHIWAIDTIDQGLEILTGHPAGKQESTGQFAPGSVHYKANAKLKAYADIMKAYMRG